MAAITSLKKVVIAGGTGFVGSYLATEFKKMGCEVIIISRQRNHIQWQNTEGIIQALEHASLLINLAGKSISVRHTEENKKSILKSRIETTKTLGEAVVSCIHPPTLWINASAAGIYKSSNTKGATEVNGTQGSDFLAAVVKKWEHTFFSFKLPETRQVAMRQAIVLGKGGGFIKPFINIVRFGLGGTQGSGTQMFSWVHIEDLFNIILFIHDHPEMKEVVNASSPNAVTNTILMKSLRTAMKMPVGIPAPEWALKIGAFIVNTDPSLTTASSWVIPQKLIDAGYTFKHPTLLEALKSIV